MPSYVTNVGYTGTVATGTQPFFSGDAFGVGATSDGGFAVTFGYGIFSASKGLGVAKFDSSGRLEYTVRDIGNFLLNYQYYGRADVVDTGGGTFSVNWRVENGDNVVFKQQFSNSGQKIGDVTTGGTYPQVATQATFGSGELLSIDGAGDLQVTAGGVKQGSSFEGVELYGTLEKDMAVLANGNVVVLSANTSAFDANVYNVSQVKAAPLLTATTINGLKTSQNVVDINYAEYAVYGPVATLQSSLPVNFDLSYTIVGGADAARFSVADPYYNITGAAPISFSGATPNFEAPTDSNGDNIYEVVVQVSDGSGFDQMTLRVAVTDVNETPVINSNGGGATATILVAENTVNATTVSVQNSFGAPITYSIVGGTDAADFVFSGNILKFRSGPNFEAPLDSDGNNVYDVIVQASSINGSDTQALTISVSDVNENPTINGTSSNDYLFGTGFSDDIFGFAGNDTLDGAAGIDDLSGGIGDDTYVFDSSGDDAIELAGEGIDTVRTTATSVTLDANVENAVAIGTQTANQSVTMNGNDLNNIITGNAARNVIDGKAGADRMVGGTGNDTYTVDNIGDVVVENLNEGTDLIKSATLDLTLGANIESGTLTGKLNLRVSGNDANNTLTGNTGANLLEGQGGDDTLNGGLGNDLLSGGIGSDVLKGGKGSDALYGGSGADKFTFSTEVLSDFSLQLYDYVYDFSRAEGDRFDLKLIDADTSVAGNQAFTLVRNGGGFLGAPGELSIYQYEINGVVYTNIAGNTDADLDVEFVIGIVGAFELNASDFVL